MELTGKNSKFKNEYTLKSIFLGNHNVGKSTILHMFVYKYFKKLSATIGTAFSAEDIIIKPYQSIRMQLWDTAGAEKYRSIAKSYMRDVHVAFFVFDITNRKSWTDIDNWKKDMDDIISKYNNIPLIVLVACKSDLQNHVVTIQEIKNKANEWDCKYYIVSCVNNDSFKNISDMITNIAKDFHRLMENNLKCGIEIPISMLEDNTSDRYVNFYKPGTINNCCLTD